MRYALKGVFWGPAFNVSMGMLGAFLFYPSFEILPFAALAGTLLAVAVFSGIIVSWTRKTEAKFYALYEISTIMNSSLQLEKVLQEIIHLVHRVMKFQHCHVLLTTGPDELLLVASSHAFKRESIQFTRQIRQLLLEDSTPFIRERPQDYEPLKEYLNKFPCQSLALIPIYFKGKVVGVLHVDTSHRYRFSQDEITILSLVANQAAIAIENASLYREMEEKLKIDGLTGVYNHRHFQEALHSELERAQRYHYPLSLAMVDVDHFKKFNDRFGHPRGDQVLKELASVLKEQVRGSDLVARYGGEEFAIIIPQTGAEQAIMVVDRIRKLLENRLVNDTRLTISVGVACYPVDAQQKQELIDKADRALYVAKARGRNRVESVS